MTRVAAAGLGLAGWLGWSTLAVTAAYLALNLAYSFRLKHLPLIDVIIIAAGFLLRVLAGCRAIGVEPSPWLLLCTAFLALFIALAKRRQELSRGNAEAARRVMAGYSLPLLDQFITIVSGTTIVAYSFYTFFRPEAPGNHTLMLTIPFVVYAIFRYLYLIQVKHAGGVPEDILLSDRPMQIAILLWGLTVLAVFYLF